MYSGPQVQRGAWGSVGGEDKVNVMVFDSRRAMPGTRPNDLLHPHHWQRNAPLCSPLRVPLFSFGNDLLTAISRV